MTMTPPACGRGHRLRFYRDGVPLDTAPGTGAYPVARVVKVPLPWVRLRSRVA
jgi:hypothetical protein